jgi:hypothetical protein
MKRINTFNDNIINLNKLYNINYTLLNQLVDNLYDDIRKTN